MIFPGYDDEETALFNATMEAIIRHIMQHNVRLPAEEIALRFVKAINTGERDPEKLKMLTLGAEGFVPGLTRPN